LGSPVAALFILAAAISILAVKMISRESKRFPHLLFALACVLFSAGCAINPVTGKQNFTLMSEANEMRKRA
jgi:hypothetical protein